MDSFYDPRYLRELAQRTGLSCKELSGAIGIPIGTFTSYMKGGVTNPNLRYLVTLADYFAVPLDLIVGRCDSKMAEDILQDYGAHFMELRRASHEVYLKGRKESIKAPAKATGEVPWPYNLLVALFGDGEKWTLVDDKREAYIVEIVNKLDPRQADFVLKYYRDGLTFAKISRMDSVSISRERVRQITEDALSLLRNPPYAIALKYGEQYMEEFREIESAKAELASRRQELEHRKREIEAEEHECEARVLRLESLVKQLTTINNAIVKAYEIMKNDSEEGTPGQQDCSITTYSMNMKDLNLTNRAYHSLFRGGCETVGDVIRLLESGTLLKLKSMGEISAREVLLKILELTGKDYSAVNGL